MKVLVACEYSAVVRDAFLARGFDAREIEGFPGYVVTACGQIFSRNHPTGPLRWFKRLNGHIDKKGYRGLTLCNDDGHFPRRVHRVVAEAFLPNPQSLPCVRHLDGDPTNNCVSNLAWGTYAENEEDKRGHGTWDARRTGKLKRAEILKIREMSGLGVARKVVAKRFSVSTATIGRIVNGKIWGNV